MRRIKLRNMARYMLIDNRDFKKVSKYRWYGRWNRPGGRLYAVAFVADQRGRLKNIYSHRLIIGAQVGQIIDHKNGRTLDNRRHNLRFCTTAQNGWNSGSKGGSSKYKGVSAEHREDGTMGRWRAWICRHGESYALGSFQSERAAARAYDEAARELHGDFAYTNFRVRAQVA